MGGIKNREEKKKLNHVVSSGGCGGMKGPATVDKRLGAELPCPYCDRIFKQVPRQPRRCLWRFEHTPPFELAGGCLYRKRLRHACSSVSMR